MEKLRLEPGHGMVRAETCQENSRKGPSRSIANAQGEVAALQTRIASPFSKRISERRISDLEDQLERVVAAVSRMSGYVLMTAAIAGIIFLFTGN